MQQSVDDFLDEDEREERARTVLTVKVRQCLGACREAAGDALATGLHTSAPIVPTCKLILDTFHPAQDDYDTFGTTAADAARSAAQRDAQQRPSLIPGPIIEELVVPVANGIGKGETAALLRPRLI